MKGLIVALIVLLCALQYRLWFGEGSVQEVWRLREQSRTTQAEMLRLQARNQALAAEVRDLKSGLDAVEERARADLGMVGEGETFYRFVREKTDADAAAGDSDAENDAPRDERPASESLASEPDVVPEED